MERPEQHVRDGAADIVRDTPPFNVPPFGDDADIRDIYVGSVGPLPTGQIADRATEVDVDVHARDTGLVDLVMWAGDGPEVVESLQLTPADARCLAALLLKAAGSRPGRRSTEWSIN